VTVPSYVLLISGDDVDDAGAAELGGRTARQADWVAGLRARGALRDGGRIEGDSVRVRAGEGRPAVIDVPTDALGSVRSWLLVDAADLSAAVSLARTCPEAAHGDVRVLAVDG
jgi:hypothetical protein